MARFKTTATMKLSELLTGSASLDMRTGAIEIGGVTADSRAVKRGDVFVAVPGTKADGMVFAAPAALAGAGLFKPPMHSELLQRLFAVQFLFQAADGPLDRFSLS